MAEVAAQLPEGSVMQRWQVDAYADEPYCDNFRGVGRLVSVLHLHTQMTTLQAHLCTNLERMHSLQGLNAILMSAAGQSIDPAHQAEATIACVDIEMVGSCSRFRHLPTVSWPTHPNLEVTVHRVSQAARPAVAAAGPPKGVAAPPCGGRCWGAAVCSRLRGSHCSGVS
jgi:hypothetical protein